MKRRSRKKLDKKNSHSAVRFELESNAEELFLSHLDQHMPPDKDSGLPDVQTKKKAARKSNRHNKAYSIDLHGQTLLQAQSSVYEFITTLILDPSIQQFEVKVITGKGLHSGPGGAVLASHIYAYILSQFRSYIISMDESPADLSVNGTPIRGHFCVVMKS